nr:choline-phosphate cytidylyltransferase A-like [Quercus suber]POF16457.1 putative choline-phosphate cytidylyltransferase [Quercus suber]
MPPKRKRAGTTSKESVNSTTSSAEHDSRDVSTMEVAEPGPDDVKERKNMDPPAKRVRSTRTSDQSQLNGGKTAEDDETGSRPSTSGIPSKAEMPANGAADGTGENGEAGQMRMPPPPKAGSIDPVGYKTNPAPQGRPVRVYADGVFDMFHLGHMRVLQQAKTAFPDTYLIVGVTGDAETHKRKGLTVMSGKERAESLRHCRWVDEVVEDCPWIINMEFLQEHQIDFVAHDDIPYGASEGDDIYKPIKERGMFLVTQRTEGVSTTGIITKIVRDYEKYISRQLRRGTSRKELNVSWLKKNELDIKRHVFELRDNIRNNWTTTGQELTKEFRSFWQPSRPSSPVPSLRNGTPSRTASGAKSPLGFDRSSRSGGTPGGQQRDNARNNDFEAGYAMGLIGSVKNWMEGSRKRNLSDSRPISPEGSEGDSSENKSPVEDRGRRHDRTASKQLEDELGV